MIHSAANGLLRGLSVAGGWRKCATKQQHGQQVKCLFHGMESLVNEKSAPAGSAEPPEGLNKSGSTICVQPATFNESTYSLMTFDIGS